ncbi:MAG: response regulator transcription factor [Phycisphaerales bacterium]|jgi:DNA-binding response OmpR family regulator
MGDSSPSSPGPESTRFDGVLVLVVDDDTDIRESFAGGFRAEGAEVLTCSDGQEAVVLCGEHQPDIVILDMMLPRRSGFLVLEKIKGYEESPLVIMVTANEGKRHQAYAEGYGADRYLTKPVSLAKLLDVAAELIEAELE